MNTLLLGIVPQNKLTEVLCWTLLHSLWQGLVLALLAGLVLTVTKRSSPLARYRVLLSLLLLFTIGTASTFIARWTSRPDLASSVGVVAQHRANSTQSVPNEIKTVQDAHNIQVGDWLNKKSGIVMLAWLLCFTVQCITISSGLGYMNRLRTSATPVSLFWERRLEELKTKIGIAQEVRLMYSSLVKVPVMIGISRPLILLPLSLMSHLPPAYIESILLHELAHIRRRDFVINLFQKVVEAVFFFNPSLLWLSSKLREEREACCDNIVLQEGNDRRSYLEALMYFQDQSLKAPHYAMALQSTSNHLFNRVKRMLTQENNKLNKMEKNMLVLGLLGLSAFAFIPQGRNPVVREVQQYPNVQVAITPAVKDAAVIAAVGLKPVSKKAVQAKPVIVQGVAVTPVVPADTIPAKKDFGSRSRLSKIFVEGDGTSTSEIITSEPDGKTYRIKKVAGKITEFSVDGKQIALNDLAPYQALLENLERQARKREAKMAVAAESRKRAEVERQNASMARIRALRARRETEQGQRTQELKSRMAQQASRARLQRAQMDEKRQVLELKRSELKQQEQRMQVNKQAAQRTTSEIGALIQDMQAENLIKEGEAASFTLTAEKLTINGRVQNNSILQKFKERHQIREGDSFQYQTDGIGTTKTKVVRK